MPPRAKKEYSVSRNTFNGIHDLTAETVQVQEDRPGIYIDFSRTTGIIKPLHGINNSPVTYGEALPELKEAGIPYVRLHDAVGAFGGTHFVDVPNIFPDFSADPADPNAYDFSFTDAYLKGLTASGLKIFYRLGVTIEHYWRIKPYNIHPPKDFTKWARICAGIVRHYNEGWADGFHYDIRYWEIWNEPENPPMWTGTREQFFELYKTTANHLKNEFPDIKVGGYASCGFYAINRPDQSDFFKSFVTYFDEFLKFITAPTTRAPLDFFSWHLYTTDPHEIIVHADFVARKLTEHGLTKTENIFNEWNYVTWGDPDGWDSMKEMPGAAFTAAAFCLMQESPIDKAMYYDALPERTFCGLYYFPSGKLTKTYYSFKAFNELFQLGEAVACRCSGFDELYACAAKDRTGKAAALIVNRKPQERAVTLVTPGMERKAACFILDNSRVLTETKRILENDTLTLPPLSVLLLRFN